MKRNRPKELKPGDKFGMLTYIGPAGEVEHGELGGRKIKVSLGKWRCDCGTEKVLRNYVVMSGKTRSCGCLRRQKGEAWRKGERVKKEPVKQRENRTPVLLVDVDDRLVEVYDPSKELIVWSSHNGIDIVYDLTEINSAWRRDSENTWEKVDVPSMAGILSRTPGTLIWTGDNAPPVFDPNVEGWEIVKD